MSEIRPLRPDDIEAVAALFQAIFRDPAAAPPRSLAAYLRRLYLEMPGRDPEIAPLVHVEPGGDITGFVGVNALPMRHGERRLRAAICGSLMVRDREADPMAGARLLKAFLAGPQDISFSETASEVSARMWTGLRGVALPQYSLDWVRLIRPAAFLVDVAASRLKAARLALPLARGLDRVARGRIEPGGLRWSAVPGEWPVQGGLGVAEIDGADFAGLVESLTQHFALRPDWAPGQLEAIIADAGPKPDHGEAVFARVEARGGKPVGAFAYHWRPGRVARVLQVLARPGQAGPVVDCLIGDAARRGAAGLRGRTQPALLDAMLGRRIAFTHVASTVVHSREPELVRACRDGEVFFNGVAGEHWSRLIGGSFE
ncbi:MAG: hypothetical protein DCC69_08915 [Hyphomicrobiales bacterium]|nr:MAG: hypothetical protein DCC69_08915 [Hyphomicrobiales bacterium]